jgi:hypothetical protein
MVKEIMLPLRVHVFRARDEHREAAGSVVWVASIMLVRGDYGADVYHLELG